MTPKNPEFFDEITRFSGQEPGTGGLVTFKDSSWLMSIVVPHQPHFLNQPADLQVFWGYSLFPTASATSFRSGWRIYNGAEVLRSCVAACNSISIQLQSKILAFRQPVRRNSGGCGFTVGYSVRAAQMAVYYVLGIDRRLPPVTPRSKSLHVRV